MRTYQVHATDKNVHKWITVAAESEQQAREMHPDFNGTVIRIWYSDLKEPKILMFGG